MADFLDSGMDSFYPEGSAPVEALLASGLHPLILHESFSPQLQIPEPFKEIKQLPWDQSYITSGRGRLFQSLVPHMIPRSNF